MKRFLLASACIALVYVGHAQVTSLSVETFAAPGTPSLPDGMTTYRVYANTTNANDFVSAVFGDALTPLSINSTGTIHQDPLGSSYAHTVNALLFGVFPALQYDSWLTLGVTPTAGVSPSTINSVGMEVPLGAFAAGQSLNVNSSNGGSWFLLFPNAEGYAGADLKVLIAQITTNGTLYGSLNMQVFVNGVQANNQLATGLPFSSDPGAVFGCTDPAATNYNPLANTDTGNCVFPCALTLTAGSITPTSCSNLSDGSISVFQSGGQYGVDFGINLAAFRSDAYNMLLAGNLVLRNIRAQGSMDVIDYDGLVVAGADSILDSYAAANNIAIGNVGIDADWAANASGTAFTNTFNPVPTSVVTTTGDFPYMGAFNPNGTNWLSDWSFLDNSGVANIPLADPVEGESDCDCPELNQRPTVVITDNGGAGTGTTTWTCDTTYVLEGIVFVNSGQVLTIEPGTVVKGADGNGSEISALIVARGGKIFAEGTPGCPVVFTHEADSLNGNVSYDLSGQWGGLIILGAASTNLSSTNGQVEGIPSNNSRGQYGGTNNSDNSGKLRYVSIRHGGASQEAINEFNGLTLAGVGSGTTIDHIEVISTTGDGIQFLGGTVSVNYAAVAWAGDDSFDWDQGWRGTSHHWFSIHPLAGGTIGYGLEGDGDDFPNATPNQQPFTNPTVTNWTMIGNTSADTTGMIGMVFRANSGGDISNVLIVNFEEAIEIEDLAANPPSMGTSTFSGLSGGVHTISALDGAGCTQTLQVTVPSPAPVALNAVLSDPITCNGDNDAVIVGVASGGTGAFSYSLSGPMTVGPQASGTFSNLGAGLYTVTAVDANGCTKTNPAISVSNPSALNLYLTSSSGATCFNTADGVVVLTPMGGSGLPSSMQYSTNGVTFAPDGVAGNTGILYLAPGTYTIYVQDVNGCIGQVANPVTVTGPPAIVLNASADAVLCAGDQNGSISVLATGGTGDFSYSFEEGAGSTVTFFGDLAAGTYTISATDDSGCNATSEVVVAAAVPIQVSATATPITCNGDANGFVTGTASGGTGAYLFSIDNVIFGAGSTFGNLLPGTYTVYVEDENGCTSSSMAEVTQPAPLVLAGVVTDDNGTGNGSIDVTVAGGTTGYSFSWTGPNGFTASTQSISGIVGGTYTLTVTDANGCTATQTFDVVTGIEELLSGLALAVFPNPTSGAFTLALDGLTGEVLSWELRDLAGRLVDAEVLGARTGEVRIAFDVAEAASGVYLLNVQSGSIRSTVRVLVQH